MLNEEVLDRGPDCEEHFLAAVEEGVLMWVAAKCWSTMKLLIEWNACLMDSSGSRKT